MKFYMSFFFLIYSIFKRRQQLNDLEKQNLLRGSLTAEEQMKMIQTTTDLKIACNEAKHVQVCFYSYLFSTILLKFFFSFSEV